MSESRQASQGVRLTEELREARAITCTLELQPAGGDGDGERA